MAEIVRLNAPEEQFRTSAHAETVVALEQWLERAKSGRYTGIAICGAVGDGSVDHEITNHEQHGPMVGAVSIMLHKLIGTGVGTEV